MTPFIRSASTVSFWRFRVGKKRLASPHACQMFQIMFASLRENLVSETGLTLPVFISNIVIKRY